MTLNRTNLKVVTPEHLKHYFRCLSVPNFNYKREYLKFYSTLNDNAFKIISSHYYKDSYYHFEFGIFDKIGEGFFVIDFDDECKCLRPFLFVESDDFIFLDSLIDYGIKREKISSTWECYKVYSIHLDHFINTATNDQIKNPVEIVLIDKIDDKIFNVVIKTGIENFHKLLTLKSLAI